MRAGTEPARWAQPRAGSEGVTLEWLDALAAGTCTPEAFLAAMRGQSRGDSDEGWEVISLLDQYYRRGKIKAEIFHSLKSRLESSAIKGEEAMASNAQAARPRGPATVKGAAAPAQRKLPAGAAETALPVGPPAAAIREVAVGDVLRGRYRLRGLIGQGVMGTVFEAMDEYRLALPAAGQRLAIKVLHAAVTQRDEVLIELQRQFQHLQFLSHPNIVRVHEFDHDGDVAFFTMELLNGAPLGGVLTVRNGTGLPRPYALAVMREVGAALAYAHSRGIVHGDINLQNIFVTNEGELRIMDFGASNRRLLDRWAADIELSDTAPVAPSGYASCQMLEGQQPDARDDVFSFACVAYVLLAGRHPFPNRTAVEARAQRLRPKCPPGLGGGQWRILSEGLRWERDERPSDLQKWLDRFDLAGAASRIPALPVLVNAPAARSRTGLLTTVAVTILALAAAAGFWALADYDSFTRHVGAWTGQTPTARDDTRPPLSAPAAARPATKATVAREPAPAVVTHPVAAPRSTPVPVPVSVPVSVSVPVPVPAPAPALVAPPASLAPAPAAASGTVATPGPASVRAAPAAQPSAGEAARAAYLGPARIEMAAETVDIQPEETMASVMVRRRGNLHGDGSFRWWTESGTAKPGRDFAPAMPREEHFEDGSKSVILNIPVSATSRTQAKSFFVMIDQTDGGPALGERNLTMVTLQP